MEKENDRFVDDSIKIIKNENTKEVKKLLNELLKKISEFEKRVK